MKDIRFIIYDFDGVLTDNRVWVSEDGKEIVACNRSDGLWIEKLKNLGVAQLILSKEKNPVVSVRAKKLGIEVVQGQDDKASILKKLSLDRDVPLEKICYVGNDVNDLECMELVGLPLAPQDSHPTVLSIAKKVLPVNGGAGIVRFVWEELQSERKQENVC